MIFTRGLKVCLAVEPVDFRKSFEGLSLLVRGVLKEDERSSRIFVFTNRKHGKRLIEARLLSGVADCACATLVHAKDHYPGGARGAA